MRSDSIMHFARVCSVRRPSTYGIIHCAMYLDKILRLLDTGWLRLSFTWVSMYVEMSTDAFEGLV